MSALVGDMPHEHYSGEGNENENEVNFMLTPDMRPEIKDEPPEDINDIQMHIEPSAEEKQLLTNGNSVTPVKTKPTITLTPTMKLMASPNPVDPKRKFPCPYDNCTKSYGKSSHLRSHLTWHTGIKPYVCQEPNCGKSFTRSDELNRHSRTHTGEKPFECMQCAKKFSRSDHLTKHVATHTKQIQSQKRSRTSGNQQHDQQLDSQTDYLPTSPTPENPPTPKKLTAVKSELTEMSLPQEGMNYNDGMHFMASLLECAQFKHGRHVLEPENLTDEPLMPIPIKLEHPEPTDEFKIVNAATENDEDGDGGNAIENGAAEDEMEDRKPIPSILRAATFQPNAVYQKRAANSPAPLSTAVAGAVSALSVINSSAHKDADLVEGLELDDDDTNDDAIMPEANAPPLPLAGAPFAVPRFDLYEDDVDPERPYRCKECIKCFKRQDDLNRHLRTHTGEKPYACVNCSKRFMRSDHLKKHLKTHSKKR